MKWQVIMFIKISFGILQVDSDKVNPVSKE